MRLQPLIYLLLAAAIVSCTQPETATQQAAEPILSYDSLKAAAYGADDYGMKKYVMAFLYKGSNKDMDSARSVELQNQHMENIIRMAEEGKLLLAGPFFGSDSLRGIYVFDVRSLAEAEALTNTDPAIQEGALGMDLKEWYGSAALMGLNEVHKTLEKKSVTQ